MCVSYVPGVGFDPADHTVASGSNRATEWYMRANAWVPAGAHVCVAGSKMFAFRLAVLATLCCAEPPTARIFPFGRITAFMSVRGALMDGSKRHCGVAAERSIISALAVA